MPVPLAVGVLEGVPVLDGEPDGETVVVPVGVPEGVFDCVPDADGVRVPLTGQRSRPHSVMMRHAA